jgi:predicted ATPase/DNA-binding winged helix-turn-helix (wHTH) protein
VSERIHIGQAEMRRADCSVRSEIRFDSFRLFPARRLLLDGDSPVRIGSRALDLLIALINRPGELVSKAELVAKIWPNTFVEESNLKVQIGALRRSLGDGRSGKRYISTITGRGYSFVAPIIIRSDEARAVPREHSVAQCLLNTAGPLCYPVGFDEVIARISDRLTHHRLITLVGPGGVGKTTAATAAAARTTSHYEHGICFVDLTEISDADRLPEVIASSVNSGGPLLASTAELVSFLRMKRMLMVLDNCEHLIAHVADLVLQMLQSAPEVQVLATSREPLSVKGENLCHIRPLALPPCSHGLTAAGALEYPAIQLFVERAADVLGGFKLRDADVPTAIDICRKLDGMPLAIELAAGSIAALGLQGLASSVDHPLRLPTSGSRSAPPRHRTLRAVLDWSYRLLSEEERKMFRRLSVFPGSFTVEDAATVYAEPTQTTDEAASRIRALLTKSLIVVSGDGSEVNLQLQSAARAYAAERLFESAERDLIVRRSRGVVPWPEAAANANQTPRFHRFEESDRS